MIPLKDHNPTRRPAFVTMALIAANVAVYFLLQSPQDANAKARFTFERAAIPCEVVHQRPLDIAEVRATTRGDDRACGTPPTRVGDNRPLFPQKQVDLAILYSMFLHGSLLHIGGNMLFLWVFGNNIEDAMGHAAYLLFYLASGLVAAAAHMAVQPSSTVPIIGASGAVAGVMGAYLVLFPNVRIRSLFIFIIVLVRDVPAKWLLGLWFIMQFLTNPASGVAWVAHVGGFIFGALVALLLRDRLRPDPPPLPPVSYRY